jgi:hypothetical protein
MKKLIALLLLTGCSSGSSGPTLVGSWIFQPAQGPSGGFTFKGDGTYSFIELSLTSSNTANAEGENGTYADDGQTLTLTPKESSCPGPDPVRSVSYAFSNGDLVLSGSTEADSYVPQPSTATSSFSITLGCFDGSGNFTQMPLAPVSN